MAQLLHFPTLPKFVPNDSETALIAAIDILGNYLEPGGPTASQACAQLLGVSEIGSRLATDDDMPQAISGAGDALDLIAGALEQHYVEGLSAEEVCDQLLALFGRPEVIEIYDTVMTRRPGGIRGRDRRN